MMRALLPRSECLARLQVIFPRAAFDPVFSNPLAAAALAAMLYVDAVVPDDGDPGTDATWARPSLCLWMNDATYACDAPQDRAAWRDTALRHDGRNAVISLLASWGIRDEPLYRENSRETLRDETFPGWLDHGAMRLRPGIATTSSRPRWALAAGFADLFAPDLEGDALTAAIDAWRETRLAPGDLLRISTFRDRERQAHAIQVTLPDGRQRSLEPGDASLILKGVIERWASARLRDP